MAEALEVEFTGYLVLMISMLGLLTLCVLTLYLMFADVLSTLYNCVSGGFHVAFCYVLRKFHGSFNACLRRFRPRR
jgi:hypothetical protein